MSQIQIHFTRPGEWGKFRLTALYEDLEGYSCRDIYTPEQLPPDIRETLGGLISSVVQLGAPWRAVHVVANYRPYAPAQEAVRDEETGELISPATGELPEAVLLTLRVRRDGDNQSKTFSPTELPELTQTSAAVLSAFKSLTGQTG